MTKLDSKPGNRLFHYCKLKTAIEHILPDRQLLLGNIFKTNDPRENKDFVFGAITENKIDLETILRTNEKVSKILRDDTKLICFSDDSPPVFFGYEYSSMWAHYGDMHEGICIELDKEKFLEENKKLIQREYLKKINYVNFDYNAKTKYLNHTLLKKSNENYRQSYLEEFRKKHLDYLYFTKYAEWQNEHEVRLIHFSSKGENEYCKIEDSLVNIFVGINFNENYLPSIKQLARDVPIQKLVYQSGRLTPTISIKE